MKQPLKSHIVTGFILCSAIFWSSTVLSKMNHKQSHSIAATVAIQNHWK